MIVLGWIFGILLVIVAVATISLGMFFDLAKQKGKLDKIPVEVVESFGIPLAGIIFTGLFIGLTGNVFCRMIFALIGLAYGVYAVARTFKVNVPPIPSAVLGGVYAAVLIWCLMPHIKRAFLCMSITTCLWMLGTAVAIWFSIGYAKDKKTILLLISLLITFSVAGITVKKVWRETVNPENRMQVAADSAKDTVKDTKEELTGEDSNNAKAETDSSEAAPEQPKEPVFDGIVDSNEELEQYTKFSEIAKSKGISSYDYLNHTEDGRVFLWIDGEIFCYNDKDGSLVVATEDSNKQVEVIGNDYYTLGTDAILYKNGKEAVAENVADFSVNSDGKLEYKSQGEIYTLN